MIGNLWQYLYRKRYKFSRTIKTYYQYIRVAFYYITSYVKGIIAS